jgi:predicted transcriptional regulator
MRRDRELQIKLLRQVRDRIDDPVFQETPKEQLAYNAGLLIDEGLVEGKKVKGNQGQCVGAALIALTPAGHDFLEAIDRAAEAPISNQSTVPSMTIFISHSSRDSELAGKLAKLFQLAFTLPAREIRCTSVAGYKLEVGADTDEVLRQEVKESKLFLALITPTSIRSSYVLFELGGRWCTGLPMFPVLGRGATSRYLEGPLGGFNALNLQHRPEVLQLLEDMERKLDREIASTSSIDDAIAYVCEAASMVENETTSQLPIEATANDPLAEDDKRILHYIYEAHPERPEIAEIAEKLGIRLRDVGYSIRKLMDCGFISEPPRIKALQYEGRPNPNGHRVLDKGIEYIRATITQLG